MYLSIFKVIALFEILDISLDCDSVRRELMKTPIPLLLLFYRAITVI